MRQDTKELTDEAWRSVLQTVDETYRELVAYQERLERQNQELTAANRLIESVLASIGDIMIIVGRDNLVQEVSRSLLALKNCDRSEIVGRGLSEIFEPSDRPPLAAVLRDMKVTGDSSGLELAVRSPSGPQPYDIDISPLLTARRKYSGAVLIGRPLGELRQAYAELERSHEQLKEAQIQLVRNEKLASLGRLLAGVAHELNNPIGFVYASVHALEKYVSQFETYFRHVQDGAPREELVALRDELKLERNLANLSTAIRGAREGSERVRDIVSDLRRLAADGPTEMAEFDLVETTRIAAGWVERGARRAAPLSFSGPSRILVRGVSGHIQQVVMNLVQNAFDAVKEVESPEVRIVFSAQGAKAVLLVEDNGPGVAEDALAAVFDPFYSTKPVGEGTGLGLSISAKIAQEHNGRLTVEPGPGGRFRLELPLAEKEGQQ